MIEIQTPDAVHIANSLCGYRRGIGVGQGEKPGQDWIQSTRYPNNLSSVGGHKKQTTRISIGYLKFIHSRKQFTDRVVILYSRMEYA